MSIRKYGGGILISGVMVPMCDEDVRRLVDEGHIRGGAQPPQSAYRALSMGMMQRVVGLWARQTFPNQTDERIMKHIEEEVEELRFAALEPIDEAEIVDNIADVVLLLMTMAERHRIDTFGAVADKHAINTQREFAFDPEAGYDRHVEPKVEGAHVEPGVQEAMASIRKQWMDRVMGVDDDGRMLIGKGVLIVPDHIRDDVEAYIKNSQ
jgi:NTP pyrophosphatase (non-canonical NTP hydrolase)